MKEYKALQFLVEKKFDHEKCIVLGNGLSAKNYVHNENTFTIGVNDICKLFTPDILLLVDTRARFERKGIEGRMDAIDNATPKYRVVQDLKWGFDESNTYRVKFGKFKELKNLDDKNIIDIGLDSPYMGVQLAYKLGFKKIGLLGVDFTPHHFYKNDGDHELVKCDKISTLNSLYGRLYTTLLSKKVQFVNLNKKSRITTIPFADIENF